MFATRIRSIRAVFAATAVAGLMSCSAAWGQVDGKSIPNGPDVKTNAKYREDFYRYYLQLEQAYREHTNDSAEVQALGSQLFKSVARIRTLERAYDHSVWMQELKSLSQRAIDAGSSDPLILQRHARLLSASDETEAAQSLLLRCEEAFQNSEYPPLIPLLNSFYLCSLTSNQDNPLLLERFPQFAERFITWISHDTKNSENRRFVLTLAHELSQVTPNADQKQQLLDAIEKEPDLDPWFRDTLAGAIHIDIASNWTGLDSANIAWPWGQMEDNTDHFALARERLVKAWKMDRDLPEPATYMIRLVANEMTRETPRLWFDRAVAAEMDYPSAYNKFMDTLTPESGGDHKAMYQFGLECFETGRFDTVVPLQLLYQVLALEYKTGFTGKFWRNPKSYSKLKEMFAGYEQAPPLPKGHQLWNPTDRVLALRAALELKTEHWDDATSVLEQIDGRLTKEARDLFQIGALDASRAFALTGDLKDDVLAAEQSLSADTPTAEQITRAIEQFSAVRMKNTEKRAELYLASKLKTLEQLQAFSNGEWVELTFDEELTGWQTRWGNWTYESKTSVLGHVENATQGYYWPLELRSLSKFPPPYEFHAEVESLGPMAMVGEGLVVGNISFDGSHPARGRLCWAHSQGMGIDNGVPRMDGSMASPEMMIAGADISQRHLDVRVWPTSLLMLVNRNGPYYGPNEPFSADNGVGLGARHDASQRKTRFSNVKIRRITYDPLAPLNSNERLVEEGTKMVELDPDDWFGRWVRGTSYYNLEQYDQAIADFDELERIRPNHSGMLLYLASSLTGAKRYEEAIQRFERAERHSSMNHLVYLKWAELELTCEDERFRKPERALEHALQAYDHANMFQQADTWQAAGMVARAHAELENWTEAFTYAETAHQRAPLQGKQETQSRLDEYREQRNSSMNFAIACLFWEGDMTGRIIGFALTIILLAANVLLISRLARFGWLPGALAGLFGVGIALLVPSVIAVLIGLGHGSAFIKLLASIVGASAICGCFCGALLGRAKSRRSGVVSESIAIDAELIN
jgi:tetratricopeptide (TPR) repeat protein